jgi:ice-binding like protein
MRHKLLWPVMALAVAAPAFAGTLSVGLNDSALSFGLLGGTISNTGTSVINGNVGAMTNITGLGVGEGTATGTVYPTSPSDPAVVTTAYSDFEHAWSTAMTLTGATALTGLSTSQTLLGNTLYSLPTGTSSTTGITLTFNAQHNVNAVFIIQAPGNLTFNGAITFNLINGANPDNIFWVVGGDATISPSAVITFDGSILAGSTGGTVTMSRTAGSFSSTINGCVFSNATTTLAAATDINGCNATSRFAHRPDRSAADPGAPEPGSSGLVSVSCLLGGILAWRKSRSIRSAACSVDAN